MEHYAAASEEVKKRQVKFAAMEVYKPLEEELFRLIAGEVLEEVNQDKEEPDFQIFTIDEDWNVHIPVADDAQPQLLEEPQPDPQEAANPEMEYVDNIIIPPPTLEEVEQDEDIHRTYVMDRRNTNTVRKTASVVRKVQTFFREEMQEMRDILDIPPRKLSSLMCSFILGVKKPLPKGVTLETVTNEHKYHQPETLTGYYTGVARYCHDNGYPVNQITDDTFLLFRQLLDTRRAELKDMGFGNKPNEAVPMSDDDIELCWETGAFGSATPRTLQNTLYFYFSNTFGRRGRNEQYKVRWKDLVMVNEGTPDEHIHWNKRGSKTRKGKGPPRQFNPNMWLIDDEERCLVRMYKRLRDKRSEEQKSPDEHFFLTPRWKATWDMEYPWKHGEHNNMSDGAIGNIMKEVKKTAGITGAVKAHTVRKTMITNLLHAGVPPVLIAQLTGHKNLNSIANYATASIDQQRDMYNIVVNRKRRAIDSVAPGSSVLRRRPAAALGAAPDDQVVAPVENEVVAPVEDAVVAPVAAPIVAPVVAPRVAVQAPGLPRYEDVVGGMFSGSTIQGSVHVHIHYGNVASSELTNTQVHVSPTIPIGELE